MTFNEGECGMYLTVVFLALLAVIFAEPWSAGELAGVGLILLAFESLREFAAGYREVTE